MKILDKRCRQFKITRNVLIVICVFAIFLYQFFPPITVVYADDDTQSELEEQLEENVKSQLENLDFGDIEKILSSLGSSEVEIFGDSSFKGKIESIINGNFASGQSSVFTAIINLVFDDLLKFIPLLASIIVIAIICGFVSNLRSENNSKSVGDIIHFVCYGVIIILVMTGVVNLIKTTTNSISSIKGQMEIIFPILLTLMTAIGGTASVAVYQPAVAFLSSFIMQIFTSVLMPIFIFMLVFTIVSNLTSTVKLDKFTKFFGSTFKWITGTIFTVFMAFLAIQGITASTYDGVSVRTAKYAIRSYVPILGGYLSEGFDVIMSSSMLIKNAVGASALVLMFVSVISPIIQIVVFSLILKLASAILEPLTDSRISDFIYSIGKSLTLLVTMVIGVAFMYLITTGLIMCTANFI